MREYEIEKRAEWVEALRSGEYEQGTGQLIGSNGGYCCLGVLGDVSELHDHDMREYCTLNGAGHDELIPAWAESILVHLNDECRLDFEEIAEFIENDGLEETAKDMVRKVGGVGGPISITSGKVTKYSNMKDDWPECHLDG